MLYFTKSNNNSRMLRTIIFILTFDMGLNMVKREIFEIINCFVNIKLQIKKKMRRKIFLPLKLFRLDYNG